MPAKMSELEAHLVSKQILRVEAAKAELAKPATPSFAAVALAAAWLVAAIFSSPLARYYGVSSPLMFLLCMLFGSLFAFAAHVVVLQRKVNALTELVKAQAEREGAMFANR
jgi:ABC-type xylose transport system permease subunit